MQKPTENDAEEAYKVIHTIGQRKKELTKRQAIHKALVKEYLSEHPEGFYVYLEDARGSVHDYHIKIENIERVSLDKESIRAKLLAAMKETHAQGPWHIGNITPSYIARCVEDGLISAEEVGVAEYIQLSAPLKKKKMKEGRPEKVFTGPGQASRVINNTTMTVKRGDGTVELHKPQITQNGEIIQEASVEQINPDEEQGPANRWAI